MEEFSRISAGEPSFYEPASTKLENGWCKAVGHHSRINQFETNQLAWFRLKNSDAYFRRITSSKI